MKLDKGYFDLHQNEVLGESALPVFSLDVTVRGDFADFFHLVNYLAQDFIDIVESRYNVVGTQQESSASTDFVRMLLSLVSSERSELKS
jgi:hypothetical protein